jgi:hypothetical protein
VGVSSSVDEEVVWSYGTLLTSFRRVALDTDTCGILLKIDRL